MISIVRATADDYKMISDMGKVAVGETHKNAAPAEIMREYLERNYSYETIQKELADADNIYHIIYYNGEPAGFSKINLNAKHPNIALKNTTKLDRIYLLNQFFGMKLGYELLKFNIEFAKANQQSGIWLFTWVGNTRAIEFYKKAGFQIIGSHDFYVSATHSNPNHHMLLEFL